MNGILVTSEKFNPTEFLTRYSPRKEAMDYYNEHKLLDAGIDKTEKDIIKLERLKSYLRTKFSIFIKPCDVADDFLKNVSKEPDMVLFLGDSILRGNESQESQARSALFFRLILPSHQVKRSAQIPNAFFAELQFEDIYDMQKLKIKASITRERKSFIETFHLAP